LKKQKCLKRQLYTTSLVDKTLTAGLSIPSTSVHGPFVVTVVTVVVVGFEVVVLTPVVVVLLEVPVVVVVVDFVPVVVSVVPVVVVVVDLVVETGLKHALTTSFGDTSLFSL